MHDGVVIVGQTEGIHLVLGQFVEVVLLACGIKIEQLRPIETDNNEPRAPRSIIRV